MGEVRKVKLGPARLHVLQVTFKIPQRMWMPCFKIKNDGYTTLMISLWFFFNKKSSFSQTQATT